MPYATTSAALCHPRRRRKTARGECDTCYRRRRYREDAGVREAQQARCRERYRQHRDERRAPDG